MFCLLCILEGHEFTWNFIIYQHVHVYDEDNVLDTDLVLWHGSLVILVTVCEIKLLGKISVAKTRPTQFLNFFAGYTVLVHTVLCPDPRVSLVTFS